MRPFTQCVSHWQSLGRSQLHRCYQHHPKSTRSTPQTFGTWFKSSPVQSLPAAFLNLNNTTVFKEWRHLRLFRFHHRHSCRKSILRHSISFLENLSDNSMITSNSLGFSLSPSSYSYNWCSFPILSPRT